jgi:hypothetical protein
MYLTEKKVYSFDKVNFRVSQPFSSSSNWGISGELVALTE